MPPTTARARARARCHAIVPRAGAGGLGQDRAPDPALSRVARARRSSRANRRDDVHAQGGRRDARADRRRRALRTRRRRARAGMPRPGAASPERRRRRELARAALAQDARHGWRTPRPSGAARRVHDRRVRRRARAPGARCDRAGRLAALRRTAAPCTSQAARAALRQRSCRRSRVAAASRAPRQRCRRTRSHLIADLLAKRDQWQRELACARIVTDFGRSARATLAAEIEGELAQRCARHVPSRACCGACASCERYAAANLAIDDDAAERAARSRCVRGGRRDSARLRRERAAVARARRLAARGQGKRIPNQAVSVKDGFPGKGTGAGRADAPRTQPRDASAASRSRAAPGLAAALHAVRPLPRARYTTTPGRSSTRCSTSCRAVRRPSSR